MSTLWIDQTAVEEIRRHAVARHPHETGGVLMGWTGAGAAARADVLVVHAIGPGPNASHGPTTFEPDSAWHAEQVATLYAQSGRRHTYLGDWHTHPNGTGIPSRRDRRTLATIAHSPAARAPHPLFVIVEDQPGGPLLAWRWCAWWRPLQRLKVRPRPAYDRPST